MSDTDNIEDSLTILYNRTNKNRNSINLREYNEQKAKKYMKILKNVKDFNTAFNKLLNSSDRINLHENKFDYTKIFVLLKWAKDYETIGKILYFFDPYLLYDKVISKLYYNMEKINGKTYYIKNKIILIILIGFRNNFFTLPISIYRIISTFLLEGEWINGKRNCISIYKSFYNNYPYPLIIYFYLKPNIKKRYPTEEEKYKLICLMKYLNKLGINTSNTEKDYTQWKKEIGYYIKKFIKLENKLKRMPTKKEIYTMVRKEFFS